jgi:hypothetical protein
MLMRRLWMGLIVALLLVAGCGPPSQPTPSTPEATAAPSGATPTPVQIVPTPTPPTASAHADSHSHSNRGEKGGKPHGDYPGW